MRASVVVVSFEFGTVNIGTMGASQRLQTALFCFFHALENKRRGAGRGARHTGAGALRPLPALFSVDLPGMRPSLRLMRRTSSPTASKGAVLTAPRPAVSNRWRGLVVTALFLALLPALAAAPDDQVKLIEAGAEPRKELRLHPKPGDKQTAVMTIKVAIDLNIGEMPPQAIKLPAIKITSDITVKSISAEGDIIYDLLIRNASAADDPGATPLVVEPIKSALAAIQGLSGTGTLSSRGLSKALEIIHKELDLTMALCGRTDINGIGRELLLPGSYPQA